MAPWAQQQCDRHGGRGHSVKSVSWRKSPKWKQSLCNSFPPSWTERHLCWPSYYALVTTKPLACKQHRPCLLSLGWHLETWKMYFHWTLQAIFLSMRFCRWTVSIGKVLLREGDKEQSWHDISLQTLKFKTDSWWVQKGTFIWSGYRWVSELWGDWMWPLHIVKYEEDTATLEAIWAWTNLTGRYTRAASGRSAWSE